jgi:hypothetical protein
MRMQLNKINIKTSLFKNINMEPKTEEVKTEETLTEKDILKQKQKEENENERLKAKNYDQEREIKKLQALLDYAKEEKRKPGITEVDREGETMRKKRPNTFGLSDMVMPPYTKGRVAIYRISTMEEINPATGLLVDPVDVMVPGRYTFYDKFEKDPARRKKVLQNIVGEERYTDDGKEKIRDLVDDILFTKGYLHVPVESEYTLYLFMELHPNNKHNRHRPNNYPVIFERIDIKLNSKVSQSATRQLAIDAAVEIRQLKKDDLYAYAASVKDISTVKRRIDEIRDDLTAWAMNDPIGYYKLNKNAKAAIQIQVLDAINFGLVEYSRDRSGYVFQETEEVICVHTAAQDPMDELVKFLGKDDGKVWHKTILDRMNYWEVPQ